MEPCEEMANMLKEMRVLQYEKLIGEIKIRAFCLQIPQRGRRRMIRKCFKWLVAAARKWLNG